MNHDDDLERVISRSLASRSDGIGRADHSLDDVRRRVDLRRSRRRHVAAVGATASLAIGAFALTAIGSSDPTTVPLATPDGSGQPALRSAWRCVGQLEFTDPEGAAYFADCEPTTVDGTVPMGDVPVTTVVLYETTTTMVCPAPAGVPTTAPADAVATTAPCAWSTPPTTEFDPLVDDPTYSEDGPVCHSRFPGDSEFQCALTGTEQRYTVEAGDSISAIARRYRLSVQTLVSYNQWPEGDGHLLLAGEIVLIPPFTAETASSYPATTTTSMP